MTRSGPMKSDPLTFDEAAWAHILFQPYAGSKYWAVAGADPRSPDYGQALFGFLNAWQCRITTDSRTRARILEVVKETNDELQASIGRSTLETAVRFPVHLFEKLHSVEWKHGETGRRRLGGTASSKILNALAPRLFVMWDRKIREHYECEDTATGFEQFQRRMQQNAREISRTFAERFPDQSDGPVESLCSRLGCDHPKRMTMAKLLDEYNWVVITNGAAVPPRWSPDRA